MGNYKNQDKNINRKMSSRLKLKFVSSHVELIIDTNINILKEISSTKLSPLNLILLAAYYHMHISFQYYTGGLYKKLKTILPHHLSIISRLKTLSWSGHEVHIANPTLKILERRIEPRLISNSNELLSEGIFYSIYKEERIKFGENNLVFYIIEESKTNNYWCSLELNETTLHHFILGLAFIL